MGSPTQLKTTVRALYVLSCFMVLVRANYGREVFDGDMRASYLFIHGFNLFRRLYTHVILHSSYVESTMGLANIYKI
jgi:hypothetical protein